jgi:beta-glucosidase
MIIAHYKAVRIYKKLGFKGKRGAVIHFEPVYALSMNEKDEKAAQVRLAFYSGWWLDPMLKGYYPKILMDYPYITDMLPEGYQKDLDDNFIENDYIGINYYSPSHVEYVDDGKLCYSFVSNKKLPKDDYGFRAYPQGLYDTVTYLNETYPDKDIFITENGIGIKKWGNYEEELEDDYRIDYMREHLRSLARACKAGVPVKGYFHWTIMDTNELYAGGFQFMFGLTQIRYETLERVKRKSWYFYQKVIAQGRID